MRNDTVDGTLVGTGGRLGEPERGGVSEEDSGGVWAPPLSISWPLCFAMGAGITVVLFMVALLVAYLAGMLLRVGALK